MSLTRGVNVYPFISNTIIAYIINIVYIYIYIYISLGRVGHTYRCLAVIFIIHAIINYQFLCDRGT